MAQAARAHALTSDPQFPSQHEERTHPHSNGVKEAHDPLRGIRERIRQSLDETERLLIILRYVEQMTTLEIAQVLDLTEEQVIERHQVIVDKLRDEPRASA